MRRQGTGRGQTSHVAIFAVLSLFLLIQACTASKTLHRFPDATLAGSAVSEGFGLSAPATLNHLTSSSPIDTDVDGANYEAGYSNNRISVAGTALEFAPDWLDASGCGFDDLAYAIYAFDLLGQGESATLETQWSEAPATWIHLQLLIADYENNRWLNRGAFDASGAKPLGDVRSFANASEQFVIAIVACGTQLCQLESLRLMPAAAPATLTNIFFLHHSTGAGLVFEGDMRSAIASYNAAHSTSFTFWDHGYEWDGLTDPAGNNTGTNYGPNTSFTDPPDLHNLWTGADADWLALRTTILNNHEVIAFKSCFPASEIGRAHV